MMSEMEGEMAAPRVFPSSSHNDPHPRTSSYVQVSVYDLLAARGCKWFKHFVSNQLGPTWNYAHTRRNLCDIDDPLLQRCCNNSGQILEHIRVTLDIFDNFT